MRATPSRARGSATEYGVKAFLRRMCVGREMRRVRLVVSASAGEAWSGPVGRDRPRDHLREAGRRQVAGNWRDDSPEITRHAILGVPGDSNSITALRDGDDAPS